MYLIWRVRRWWYWRHTSQSPGKMIDQQASFARLNLESRKQTGGW